MMIRNIPLALQMSIHSHSDLQVEHIYGFLAEEAGDQVDAHRDHRRHQEGEDDGNLRYARDGDHRDHDHGLKEGEARHLAPVDVLHVIVGGPALALEGKEHEQAVEHLVAADACDAEVEEDADDDRLWHVAEDGAGGEADEDEDVDGKVRHTLLGHAGHAHRGALAVGQRHGHCGSHRHHVRERAHGGRVGRGQAEDRAERIEHEADDHVGKVVRRQLLEHAVLAVHEHLRQVLVEVAKQASTDSWGDHQEDGPRREGLGVATRLDDPRARQASHRVLPRRLDDGGHVKVAQVEDAEHGSEQRREDGQRDDGDAHSVVGQILAQIGVQPVTSAQLPELDGHHVGK
mmetsp:Transcript_16363/g.41086  ORF Transcript_16363/g.41086 Transcript_16363/m.41086 type:complete len:345 (+) Transcript_16363:136-1170(+)